jgi:hypothetical protein
MAGTLSYRARYYWSRLLISLVGKTGALSVLLHAAAVEHLRFRFARHSNQEQRICGVLLRQLV